MNINELIDHTILKPDTTRETVIRYCDEAKKYNFASVCVNSCHVKLVADQLKNSSIKTCTVVGFPLGAMSTAAKAFETAQAIIDGADEIDMVLNVGALKDGNYEFVKEDIKSVVKAADKAPVKVILETCLLTDEEIVTACKLAMETGAAFVKTSTGFSTGGATVHDVSLMKSIVGDKMQIKASGGVRTREQAGEMIKAGADRIGSSNGVALIS